MKAGMVYFSPEICYDLDGDPEYMGELSSTAASVMSSLGIETPNVLLDSNTEAIESGQGIFWYKFTSTYGLIVIAGDVESADVFVMKEDEFDQVDQIEFVDLKTWAENR